MLFVCLFVRLSPETRCRASSRVSQMVSSPVKNSPPPREIYACGGGLFVGPINAPCTLFMNSELFNRYNKTAEQRTIINTVIGTLAVDAVGCYIWYSEEGTGRGRSPLRPLLAVSNVTAHPSTASVPTSYYSMWHYNCLSRASEQGEQGQRLLPQLLRCWSSAPP